MANILNVPAPDKETNPRQKSIDVSDLFFTRLTPPWSRPASLPAYTWRLWVLNQPVAVVCRETLIANLLALDWKITPVNSKYKEELEPTIKYYTKLLKDGGNYSGLGLDFSGIIEWIVADLLDTPFGGAAEVGRKGGTENGRVQWIRPLDAGTLYPTLNQDFPIVQYYPNYSNEIVTFKPWEISRTYMSPHSFILREGWGMAPPEKIYFALDLLNRGDKYYANLLLDIPTAGILDLGDMEKSAAEEWITAFKTFVNDNTTSFKVPVLYEHNNKVEFLPFGKVPNDIMFNQVTSKYAALVAAAYGMSLSDIGMQTTTASGETLAGSIRQERRTRKTGFARIKSKTKSFFDHILPETLEFNWIDYDDELNVALGRARLASAQAFQLWQDGGVLASQEIRSQVIQDGLVSIALPDEIPPDAHPAIDAGRTIRYIGKGDKPDGGSETKNPAMIGNPKAPSGGGEGEVKSFAVKSKPRNLASVTRALVEKIAPFIHDTVSSGGEDNLEVSRSMIGQSLFDEIDMLELQGTIDTIVGSRPLATVNFDGVSDEIRDALGVGYEEVDLAPYMRQLSENVNKSLNGFIGRTAVYILNDALFSNGMFADSGDIDYNLIANQVQERTEKSLTDFISILVNDEAIKILNKIKEEN
jgi:hypothetical protein